MNQRRWIAVLAMVAMGWAGCGRTGGEKAGPRVVRIEAGPEAAKQAQRALIDVRPHDTIEFGEGRFDFTSTLSIEDASHVTIRGQGPDKTILSFANQQQGTGAEGLRIECKEDITLENLAIEDAKGDAVKAQHTKRIIFRNVRVEWTGGPQETNGAYGLYPVLCSDVVIENCVAIGASDAGIYVGQSEDIIVRNNWAEKNVAGIEIENSLRADVYDNTVTDNAGGILVFTLPDLPKKEGGHCRVFHNTVVVNNHVNFAPAGNIVASVPSGTGIMIMANDHTEIFDNTIERNDSVGISIVSFLTTQRPLADEQYDPYCEAIHIHHNHFAHNGSNPAGPFGVLLRTLLGTPLPDVLYDGYVDEKKKIDGSLPTELAIRLRENGEATFANFDAAALLTPNLLSLKKPNVVRDLKQYEGELPALPAVSIDGVK